MSNVLEYKGYRAKVNYSSEDNVLFGKIEGINSVVTFEAENATEINDAFKEAVDNYLAFCKINNIKPEKEYRGCFNVRVSPEMHKKISIEANKENISLNKYIEKALEFYLYRDKQKDYVMNFYFNNSVKPESLIYPNKAYSTYMVGGVKQWKTLMKFLMDIDIS